VLRVLEPALRMKAQTASNSRGWKDFICREFSWRKEKRKTAYWGMQGDPETSDPMGQGGEWGFIAYFCIARCKQVFPREEKYLFDHLSRFGTSCSLSFSPSISLLHLEAFLREENFLVSLGYVWCQTPHIIHIHYMLLK
jgi:hypothetical protein